jgi:hypothetical protein
MQYLSNIFYIIKNQFLLYMNHNNSYYNKYKKYKEKYLRLKTELEGGVFNVKYLNHGAENITFDIHTENKNDDLLGITTTLCENYNVDNPIYTTEKLPFILDIYNDNKVDDILGITTTLCENNDNIHLYS